MNNQPNVRFMANPPEINGYTQYCYALRTGSYRHHADGCRPHPVEESPAAPKSLVERSTFCCCLPQFWSVRLEIVNAAARSYLREMAALRSTAKAPLQRRVGRLFVKHRNDDSVRCLARS